MNFYKMLDIIQSKNEGRIVLCDLGCFYITSGSNALLLNKLLKLKLICQEPGVCKVGFPKSSLEKYTNLLKTLDYGYIVYDFDSENNELKIKDKYDGKNFNDIQKRNNGCTKCRFNSNNKMKEDKYLIAISKLYNMSIDDILSYY